MDDNKRAALKARHEAIKTAHAARRDLDKVLRFANLATFTPSK